MLLQASGFLLFVAKPLYGSQLRVKDERRHRKFIDRTDP